MAELYREKPEEPTLKTFEEATAYAAWLKDRTMRNFALPTLNQLKLSKQNEEVVFAGPEWTREGWIYDPSNDSVNMEPSGDSIAGFRLVENRAKPRRRH